MANKGGLKTYYIYGLYESKENLVDNCFYIGKGKGSRMYDHFQNYRLDEENNGCRNLHKTRKIKKLKRNNKNPYAKKIMKNLTEEEAYELEKFIIKEVGLDNLTNIRDGGQRAPNYWSGKSRSDETKRKLSQAHMGKSLSEEHKNKISEALSGENNPNYDRSYGKDFRNKVSESLTGRDLSEEHKRNIGKANTGEKHNMSKLSKKEVGEIKWLIKNSELSQKDISNKYSITQANVSSIKREETWSHVKLKKPNKDYG